MPECEELPGDVPPELVGEELPEKWELMIDAEGLLSDEFKLLCDEFSAELVGTSAELIGMIEGRIGVVCGDRGEPEPELDEELVIEDFSRDPPRSHRVKGRSRLSLDRPSHSRIGQEKKGENFPDPIPGRDAANPGKLGDQDFDLGDADKAIAGPPRL